MANIVDNRGTVTTRSPEDQVGLQSNRFDPTSCLGVGSTLTLDEGPAK